MSGLLCAGGSLAPTPDFGKLALAFEANQGQTDPQVRFLAGGTGYRLLLEDKEAVLALAGKAVVKLQWLGASAEAQAEGVDRQPGVSNYFRGSDPSKWHTGIPHFAQVKYKGVYPGVDLVYYGKQRQLEFDVILAAHADPRNLRLRIAGTEGIHLSPEGDLELSIPGGAIQQKRPIIYQMDGEHKRTIEGRYELRANGEIGFSVDSYDVCKPLIIDPVVSYATYLGGTGNDSIRALAVDSAGNTYVTGDTASADFPSAGNSPYDATRNGATDVFVAKLNATGTALLYATYLGGSQAQTGRAIAIDSSGAAYVGGDTWSSDFPHTPGAFQSNAAPTQYTHAGFLTKLDPTGSTLSYSTYIGTATNYGGTYVYGVAVDTANCAYVTGRTVDNLPTSTSAFQKVIHSGWDAFVIKLNATGTGEVYGTFLGGNSDDYAYGIALDGSKNVYLAGYTTSSDYPTKNPLQGAPGGSKNSGFVTKLNTDGSALAYSTYLTGRGQDMAYAIAVDSTGNSYVTGQTGAPTSGSDTFPIQNALQPVRGGGWDAFLTKINATGNAIVYSTFLGGSDTDSGLGVAVDDAGNAWVTGSTTSNDFPLAFASQSLRGGSQTPAARSADGGLTWTAGSAGEDVGSVTVLAVDPVISTTVYAGTSAGRIYQSIDGGGHWRRSDNGVPNQPIRALAIGVKDHSTLYAAVTGKVVKSIDGGTTWSVLPNTPGASINGLAVDPTDSNIVLAATGTAIFKTTDGGTTWTAVPYTSGKVYTCIATHPKRQYAVAGTADGWKYWSFDGGAGFYSQSPTLSLLSVNAVAIDPVADVVYFAVSSSGSQWVVISRSLDMSTCMGPFSQCAGSHNDGNGPGISVAVSHSGTAYTGRYYSVDGLPNAAGFTGPFPAIATDPLVGNIVYLGNSNPSTDAFLTGVNPSGAALIASTYFGGSGNDEGRAVVADNNGGAWVAGVAGLGDLAITPGAVGPTITGGTDGFLARFIPTPPPALSIAMSHSGNFMQGQPGVTYQVTVSNAAGVGPTNGTVTVTETVPPGMTLKGMEGTGWTCPPNDIICWTNDIRNGGESYSPITVTVDIAADAGPSLTNHVDLAGGGSGSTSADNVTTIMPFTCDINGDHATNVIDIQALINDAGSASTVHDLDHDGDVDVLDVVKLVGAALGLGCLY